MSLYTPETASRSVNTAVVGSTPPLRTRSTGEWREGALCATSDPEVFFPEKADTAAADIAKQVCDSCPVVNECLSHALNYGERFGVWGGLTAEERRPMYPKAVSPSRAERQRRDTTVVELHKHGRTAASIARTTEVTERTVHRIISRTDEVRKGA